jgi:Domain of unknown function (DUF4357)
MSITLGKTIQIFLPDGNPRGMKVAEFTSRTVQTVLVPRAQLEFACSRKELSNVGLYFLVGESSEGGLTQLYLGEAEDCSTRLKQHNKQKDWWTVAIVCISKTSDFTKSHVKYLEWHCHQEAVAAGRFNVDNSSLPTKSHISESVQADLMDHFDTIRILTSSLGFPFFEKITRPQKAELLACKGKRARATGEYTEDGLIVFAGSTANREFAPASHRHFAAIREQMLKEGEFEVVDRDLMRLTRDRIFPSPSQAAAVMLGRNSNGWIEWKYLDGRTLDEVKRKTDEIRSDHARK